MSAVLAIVGFGLLAVAGWYLLRIIDNIKEGRHARD